jgi:hypothetical protein
MMMATMRMIIGDDKAGDDPGPSLGPGCRSRHCSVASIVAVDAHIVTRWRIQRLCTDSG